MIVFKIVLVSGVEQLNLMNVVFVVEIIHHALIVRVFQMVMLY